MNCNFLSASVSRMSLINFFVFSASKNASVSSRIKKGDLDVRAIAYCRAKLAIDFYPPES